MLVVTEFMQCNPALINVQQRPHERMAVRVLEKKVARISFMARVTEGMDVRDLMLDSLPWHKESCRKEK